MGNFLTKEKEKDRYMVTVPPNENPPKMDPEDKLYVFREQTVWLAHSLDNIPKGWEYRKEDIIQASKP
jgi:hypothetical protein